MKFFIIFALLVLHGYCALITESNGTFSGDLTGSKLIKLGRKTHKPFLTMIGMALRNLHPCAELWSQWSPCESTAQGYFGTKRRSRNCGIRAGATEDKIETELGICEGSCRIGYNMTASGYCIKLHQDKRYHFLAEEECAKEGAHLINIDSEPKLEDVKQMIKGFTHFMLIAGERKDNTSPFTYKYGLGTSAVKWAHGHPNNTTSENCVTLHPNLHMYNKSCKWSIYFLCEYIAK